MTNVDTRQVNRDSLFLLAQLRVDGHEEVCRVKVRNLSAGGMMAEGAAQVTRGQRVEIELRNIGWVTGTVAWKQDDRFGIAFNEEINPTRAREPINYGQAPSGISEVHKRAVPASQQPIDQSQLRKI